MSLRISDTLSLPLDAATQTFAFIARKGAGKTYAAGKLVEELLEAKVQVVIIDTVGNWYGLRLAANGKGRGFDVPVFGGLRADIPLQATAGELVANVAVESGRSMILDLSQFSLADRKRFATSFGHTLWKAKKSESKPSPLFLVLEESQLIVPQKVDGSTAAMVGIYEEIVRLGRNYGIGCAMISQRPQSINKEVLNQTECLFVLQVNGSHERKALKEWITHQGMDVGLIDELPSLPIGTAYVWSPQWLGILKKVKIAPKITFDASATPKVGDTRERRNPAPLDLGELEKQMAATVETAKANDPRELRKIIAGLRADLAKAPLEKSHTEIKTERVEVPVLTDKQIERIGAYITKLETAGAKLEAVGVLAIAAAKEYRDAIRLPATARPLPVPLPRQLSRNSTHHEANTSREPKRVHHTGAGIPGGAGGENDGVTPPQRRILNALADLEGLGISHIGKSNVAVFADQSPTSSGFGNNLGRLRSMGLIEYPASGRVALTAAGRAASDASGQISTLQDLHSAWYSKLSLPKQRILGQLILAYPEPITKADLATLAGQSYTSSGYGNNLGNLRSLGLIEYPQSGHVVATPLLFPEALQ